MFKIIGDILFFYFLYNFLLITLYPLLFIFFAVNGLRNEKFTGTMKERFGYYTSLPREAGGFWLHAVSVGEAVGAIPFIRLLMEKYPNREIIVTTTTKGGMNILRNTFGDEIITAYFPFDFPWVVRRAMLAFRPSALVLMETEIWPNLVEACRRKGVPVMLLNGRVSDRMAAAKGIVKGLYGHVFSRMSALGMQTLRDVERIKELGAVNASVIGNIKFDGILSQLDEEKVSALKNTLLPHGGSLFIAGSTHPGEESIIIEVFKTLRKNHSGLILCIAPRHTERAQEVLELCRSELRNAAFRSAHTPADPCSSGVIVLDTIGELRFLYSISTLCFVGGSLIERGGHNILEPAACGRAAFYGPHTANFVDSVKVLESGGGGVMVRDTDEFAQAATKYLADSEYRSRLDSNALEAVKKNSGATTRALELFDRRLS